MSIRHLILAGILSVSLTACATAQNNAASDQASSSVQTKRQQVFAALDAQSQSSISVVKNYLDAYSRLDITAMAEFFPDDIKFHDLTASDTPLSPPPTPFIFDNKEDLLVTLKQVIQMTEKLEFKIDRIWESSGYVVVVADVIWTIKTPNDPAVLPSQLVTTFKVEGSKITEIYDYFDYNQSASHYPE